MSRLLSHRGDPDKNRAYLVRWGGRDDEGNLWADSWQPEENVGDWQISTYLETLKASACKPLRIDPTLPYSKSARGRSARGRVHCDASRMCTDSLGMSEWTTRV